MAIQAEIGLNTSPFMKGIKEVEAATERMKSKTRSPGPGGKADPGGLQIESGKKGERAIAGLAGDLMNARNSGDALGSTLARVGDVLKTGMVFGVASAMTASFIAARQRVHAETEGMLSDFAAFAVQAKENLSLGNVFEKIQVGDQAVAQFEKLTAMAEKLGSRSWVDVLNPAQNLSILTGEYGDDMEAIAKARGEAQLLVAQSRNAALADYGLQVKIAQMRVNGQTNEADHLERKLKLEREIARIRMSKLDPYAQEQAIAGATKVSAAEPKAKENAVIHSDRLKLEAAINAKIKERENLGETDKQRLPRLQQEVEQWKVLAGVEERIDRSSIKALDYRLTYETKLTEYRKLQAKFADDEARMAEAREKSTPRILLEGRKLVAAATGDKNKLEAAENQQRYHDLRSGYEAEGRTPDQADRLAREMTRLEYLRKVREDKGTPGQADADRRLGMGGYASMGTDALAEARRGNNIDKLILESNLRLEAALKIEIPRSKSSAAKFN